MILNSEPINWAYMSIQQDMRPKYLACIVTLSIILILWLLVVIKGELYLHRRKKKKYRYYKVDLLYKDSGETESAYIKTYGKLDICMYFMGVAKTRIQRIKNIDAIKEEIIDLDEVLLEEKESKA